MVVILLCEGARFSFSILQISSKSSLLSKILLSNPRISTLPIIAKGESPYFSSEEGLMISLSERSWKCLPLRSWVQFFWKSSIRDVIWLPSDYICSLCCRLFSKESCFTYECSLALDNPLQFPQRISLGTSGIYTFQKIQRFFAMILSNSITTLSFHSFKYASTLLPSKSSEEQLLAMNSLKAGSSMRLVSGSACIVRHWGWEQMEKVLLVQVGDRQRQRMGS